MEVDKIKVEKTIQEKYLESLSDKEKRAYEIAKDHLGMSFHLEKSIGFIKFKQTYESSH